MTAKRNVYQQLSEKRFYPKWIGNLLMVWLPGAFYLFFIMLIRKNENLWLISIILLLYLLVIYIFKKQKIPENAKPRYVDKPFGYFAFFVIFTFFFIISIIADILSTKQLGFEVIFRVCLASYAFIPIIIVSYLVAARKLPTIYQ